MTCAEANKVGLVEYLFSLGFIPTKIRGNDYWYLSPLRQEKEPSFKVNKAKNVWYDHGAGQGGTVVDFAVQYFNCDVSKALQKIADTLSNHQTRFVSTEMPSSVIFPEVQQCELFDADNSLSQKQNTQKRIDTNHERPPFHLHKNSLIQHKDAAETAIQIIAAKKPITDLMLRRYLKERRIAKTVVDIYCHEVLFKFTNKDKEYTAIGFKNSAGGYELRNSFFKLSSSTKYVTYITNDNQNRDTKTGVASNHFITLNALKYDYKNDDENASNQASTVSQNDGAKSSFKSDVNDKIEEQNETTKQAKSIAVFEGFFDFLTYQSIHQNQHQPLTNFLVLNSLSFFERSLLLMEKHEQVHLYLDHDEAGRKCVELALKRSPSYKDESNLYHGYKDLNEWVMHFGKLHKKQSLKVSKKNGLR